MAIFQAFHARLSSCSPFGTKRVPRRLHCVPGTCSVPEQRETGAIRLRRLVPGNAGHQDTGIGLAYPLLSASATFVTPPSIL